jgi:hypothetical protein
LGGQLGVLIEADRHKRLLAGTIGPPGRDQPRVKCWFRACKISAGR